MTNVICEHLYKILILLPQLAVLLYWVLVLFLLGLYLSTVFRYTGTCTGTWTTVILIVLLVLVVAC